MISGYKMSTPFVRSIRTFLVVVAIFLFLRSFLSLWEVLTVEHGRHRREPVREHSQNQVQLNNIEVPKSVNISNSSGQIVRKIDNFHRDTVCQNLDKPDSEKVEYRNSWQVYKAEKVEIMAYSAYFDDRPAGGLLPSIRILVVANVPKNASIYCYIWYNDLSHPYLTKAEITKTGRGHSVRKVSYGQLMYSCALPSSYPIPSHVSLSVSPCKPSSLLLPITHPVRTSWEHEFGICVAIAFGKVTTAQFVEWMEFHNQLGVTEFNIYDGDISEEMDNVFKYYKSKGLLRVFKMAPAVDEVSYNTVKLNSPASLNDCMLRNMYRYRYMIVIDFDEFIVPKKEKNYKDLLKKVDEKYKLSDPWMSYTFRNTYFLTDFKQDKTQPSHVQTLRYRRRARPSRPFYAAKSFIDPKRCFSVFNHYCYIRFPKSDKKFSIDISPDLAASHHYRKCNTNCDQLKKEETLDDTILLFKDTLVKRIDNVLDNISNQL